MVVNLPKQQRQLRLGDVMEEGDAEDSIERLIPAEFGERHAAEIDVFDAGLCRLTPGDRDRFG